MFFVKKNEEMKVVLFVFCGNLGGLIYLGGIGNEHRDGFVSICLKWKAD